MTIAPPHDVAELSARLSRVGGRTLGSLAERLGLVVPPDLRRAKGWVGTLLEQTLGATAASRAEPDFPALGVELKTLPVRRDGRPLESTFVASLDLAAPDPRWETSTVRKKLLRVAWVVVEADPGIPLAARRCGAALLWSPTPDEESVLRQDYEELVELVAEGFFARATGHRGRVLQLRPKGRNKAALRWAHGEDGARVRLAPRAFYLRPAFTEDLLRRHFQMPGASPTRP